MEKTKVTKNPTWFLNPCVTGKPGDRREAPGQERGLGIGEGPCAQERCPGTGERPRDRRGAWGEERGPMHRRKAQGQERGLGIGEGPHARSSLLAVRSAGGGTTSF